MKLSNGDWSDSRVVIVILRFPVFDFTAKAMPMSLKKCAVYI